MPVVHEENVLISCSILMLFNIYLDIDACALNFSYLVKNKTCFSLSQNYFDLYVQRIICSKYLLAYICTDTSLIYSKNAIICSTLTHS